MNTFEKISDDQRNKLRAPLPAEAVTQHPTKTYLSSIKAIYVVERINDVFGVGSFHLKTDMVERHEGGTVVVKTSLSIPTYNIYLEAFGGNDNGGEKSKNFDLGDAFKGATTDSFTKIASYLEIGIDVFKGKGNKSPIPGKTPKPTEKKVTTTPQSEYEKASKQHVQTGIAKAPETCLDKANKVPRLLEELTPNHKSWGYVKEKLAAKQVTLEVVKQTFTLSEENEKLLK